MYGGELQGFSRLSLGLEEMRYTCQCWKADYSVGGSMSSVCLKKKKHQTQTIPPGFFHVALFWLVVLLYSCVPLAKSSLRITTTKDSNGLNSNSDTV